jgi:hypothetical protein
VPNRDPVILPLTFKLPVIEADPVIIKEPEITNVSASDANTV